MPFDNEEHQVHTQVKITTEHEIGDSLLTILGVDSEDEDMKRLVLDELPNVAEYIRKPILDAVEIEREH